MALVVATVALSILGALLGADGRGGATPERTAASTEVIDPVANGADRDRFFGVAPQTPLAIEDYRRMGTGHVGVLRVPFIWGAVQQEEGDCEPEPKVGVCTWNPFDQLVGYAAAHGIQVLPTLGGRPDFAFPDADKPGKNEPVKSHPPTGGVGLDMWRDWVKAIAERYGPGGVYWEEFTASYDAEPIPVTDYQVWNEQNAEPYWQPKPNAHAYADLVRGTSQAVHAVDPEADVVLGGMFGTATVPTRRYLRDFYEVDDIEDHFDAIAIHPYSPNLKGIKLQIRWVRDVAKANGDEDVGIWVTELGWGSADHGHLLERGDKGQAQMLRRAFQMLERRRDQWRVEGVVWFTWKDSKSKNVCRFCRHAGLLNAQGKKKRSWEVYREMARNRG